MFSHYNFFQPFAPLLSPTPCQCSTAESRQSVSTPKALVWKEVVGMILQNHGNKTSHMIFAAMVHGTGIKMGEFSTPRSVTGSSNKTQLASLWLFLKVGALQLMTWLWHVQMCTKQPDFCSWAWCQGHRFYCVCAPLWMCQAAPGWAQPAKPSPVSLLNLAEVKLSWVYL